MPPAPLTLAVAPDGTLSLACNGRPVLTGLLTLHGPLGQVDAWPVVASWGVQADPTSGTVFVRHVGATVTADLALVGTDLTIAVVVQNTGTAPVAPVELTGLRYALAGPASGTLKCWDSSYVNATGLDTFHPGSLNPIGATHVTDGSTHAVFWSPSDIDADHPALFLADFAANALLPANRVTLCTRRTIQPGGAVAVGVTVRVTADGSTAGLFSGYRNALHAALSGDLIPATGLGHVPHPGEVAEFASVNARWARPDNPGGYDDGFGASPWRRLDTPAGAAAFPGVVGGPLVKDKGAAVLFWSPGGYSTTLPCGKVTADVWTCDALTNLRQIAATWPIVVKGLEALKVTPGIAVRLCDLYDGNGNEYRASSRNPAHVAAVLAQLDGLLAMGVGAFYLDSVGLDPDSTRMIGLARDHVGPSVPMWSEEGNDITAARCDRYAEATATGLTYLDDATLATLKYLWPGWRSLAIDRTGNPLNRGTADDGLIMDFQASALPAH